MANVVDSKFRGIIMPTNVDIHPDGGFVISGIDRAKVLFNSTYWDKVVIPNDILMKSGFDGESELVSEGTVETPRLEIPHQSYSGSEIAFATIKVQLQEMERRNSQMPGQWAMSEAPLTKLVEAGEYVKDRGLLIGLYGALPAPDDNTPVDKILEFKRKRKPELQRLRAALEKTYLSVAGSSDEEIALRLAVEEVDKACADLLKSSKEDWKAAKPADLKSISEYAAAFALPIAAPYLTQLGINLTLPHVAAVTAGAAALKIIRDVGSKRKSDRSSPYWFAVDLKKSGIAK